MSGHLRFENVTRIFGSFTAVARVSLEIKGRATMLDDMREVLGAGLLSLGYSMNSSDETELGAAVELSIQWKENLAKYEYEQ